MELVQRQRMLASAAMVAYAEVLGLDAGGLDAYVEAQLAAHPALGVRDGRICPRCGGTVWRPDAHRCLAAGPLAPPARPDVVVTDDGERLVVTLADASWMAVRVDPAYARLAARGSTLVRVAQDVVDRQAALLRHGGPRQSVTRAAVAAALRVHESTVSRAVAGKHALLPGGRLRPLADLFGPPGRAALDCLRDLLAAEDEPRSDAALAVALSGLGHPTARRTVAKYRALLGLPGQRERAFARGAADRPAVRR